MKKINIKIPDHLTPSEELQEIGKLLRQKTLAGNGRQMDHKRIGNEINIKDITTQITITRIGEKPIEMAKCNVCGCEYQNNFFFTVFTNYGGTTRKIKTCSEKCQTEIIILFPDRCSIKKSTLKQIRFY